MIIKETKIYKYRWFIGGGFVLLLVVWFIFRKVKDIQADNKAERALILRQRDEAQRRLEITDSIARHKEDSLLMEILGIRSRVEYKIIEREKYIKIFIDSAAPAVKFRYVDSLLGPK